MTAVAIDTTTRVGTFSVDARFRADGGITALYGPSGSGKSVTLATIAGLLRPESGTVVIGGRTVADAARGIHVSTQERHLGMVFQDSALLPHRSPLDNIALAVRGGADRRARRARAAALLGQVDATHLADAPTSALSGGEKQRISLARALAGEPVLLLLDEPFSALDQQSRLELRRLVRDLVDAEGITALLVTHDLADLEALADRTVHYEPGRTVRVE
jgi:molybdate transport system ATP-binding protein